MNTVLLRGTVTESARLSHDSHGTCYYQFILTTMRLSGVEDHLRVLVPESMLSAHPVHLGDRLEVSGSLRSFNNRSGQGSRLVLSALAHALCVTDEPSDNRIELRGALCKPPIYRRTPLGREICDLMLAVPRLYGRADYLPVIAWGLCARDNADRRVGDRLVVGGRFQSRNYAKIINGESVEKTAYEVSAIHISLDEPAEAPEEEIAASPDALSPSAQAEMAAAAED